MKLYDGGRAPNPRRVRDFLAEKGITVPTEQVDLGALQQRSEAYTAVNPMQRVPALVLDDGTVIAESMAICRYFEALQPEPPLFGRGALGSALVEMWNRRVELHLLMPVRMFSSTSASGDETMVVPQVAPWGEANKPRVLRILELPRRRAEKPGLMSPARTTGGRYHRDDRGGLYAGIETRRSGRLLTSIKRWHATVSARPSAAA